MLLCFMEKASSKDAPNKIYSRDPISALTIVPEPSHDTGWVHRAPPPPPTHTPHQGIIWALIALSESLGLISSRFSYEY